MDIENIDHFYNESKSIYKKLDNKNQKLLALGLILLLKSKIEKFLIEKDFSIYQQLSKLINILKDNIINNNVRKIKFRYIENDDDIIEYLIYNDIVSIFITIEDFDNKTCVDLSDTLVIFLDSVDLIIQSYYNFEFIGTEEEKVLKDNNLNNQIIIVLNKLIHYVKNTKVVNLEEYFTFIDNFKIKWL